MIILLFIQQKHKHCAVVFLTSRSASKHIHFALGVDCTARDTVKVGFQSSLASYTSFAGLCETSIGSCSLATQV